jgi:hypothetical protein
VPEQFKWIEDLNTRTRYANDNSFFNMAEVMISDEVRAVACVVLISALY